MKILYICLANFYLEGMGYQENIISYYHKKMGYDVEIITSQHVFKKELCGEDNYYINEFADKERRLHNNLAITITTFLLAIISFVALFVFTQLDFHWLLLDFIDVIAWVFSWETVDLIFFQRQLIKFEQRQDLKIIFAKITLSNLTKTRKTK